MQKDFYSISSAPVPRAVLRNALPAMAAMLMVLIYNLADTFFIGQTHDALQVAAVSLATPVFLLFMSVGTIFGIGGTSVISRAMGEGRQDYARHVCAFCMWGCVTVGIAMSALFLLLMDGIPALVGAQKWQRYDSALRFSLIFALLLGSGLTALCLAFTEPIVRAFLTDAQALDCGVRFARILLSTSFLFGVFYVLTNALQACGAALESLIVNVSRQGLIFIPAMFLLGALLGETGLIWAQPVADVLSLLLAAALYRRCLRRLRPAP